jgi:hypothetical protein
MAALRKAAARKPAAPRKTATVKAAGTVEKATPTSTTRKHLGAYIVDCYYCVLEDMLPGVGQGTWFLGDNDYQSYTNIHADESVALISVKKRIALSTTACAFLHKLADAFIEEARKCETAMLKYPDDATGFINEGIPEEYTFTNFVVSASETARQSQGEKLASAYDPKEWIQQYIKGEIMKPPTLSRVVRHADALAHNFIGFFKRITQLLAMSNMWQPSVSVDMEMIGGALLTMGLDAAWINSMLEATFVQLEIAKQNLAERKAAAATSPDAVVQVDDTTGEAAEDAGEAAEDAGEAADDTTGEVVDD